MKIEVKKSKPKNVIEFPVIMETIIDGAVVLFIAINKGIVLNAADNRFHKAGDFLEELVDCDDGNHWRPFNGTIELSN